MSYKPFMKFAYQGIPGSYSENCIKVNYPDAEAISCRTFQDAFELAKNNKHEFLTLEHLLLELCSADEVKNISSTASLAVKQQKGDSSVSSINQVLTFDTRDDVMSPRTGTLSNFSSSFAGLGGSVQYIKNTIATTQYFSLSDSIVASFSLSGGYLMPIGDDARIIDRFFLGGRSLRGFEPAGVSPRDRVSGDAVGGEWYYTSSLRLQFPLGLPNEFGIKGRVFTDLGSTGKTDTSLGVIDDTNSIRGSVGFGLSWKSPLGPFTIDVATPYMKESYDRTESIRFGFFTGF